MGVVTLTSDAPGTPLALSGSLVVVAFFVPALFLLQGMWWSHFPAAVAGDSQCCFVSIVVNIDPGSFPFLRFKMCNHILFSAQSHHASLLCRRNKQDSSP